jgi:hypothetical protein
MSLSLVLDVEGKDVVREVLPLGSTRQQGILVLENVREAVFEVVDWRRVLVEEGHVVLSSRRCGAIDSRKFIFRDVSIYLNVLSAEQ